MSLAKFSNYVVKCNSVLISHLEAIIRLKKVILAAMNMAEEDENHMYSRYNVENS